MVQSREAKKWIGGEKGVSKKEQLFSDFLEKTDIYQKISEIKKRRRIGFSIEDYWPVRYPRTTILDVSDELSEVKDRVDTLYDSIESVKDEVFSCKEWLSKLEDELSERPVIKGTLLFEIDESFEVLHPIPIVIEEYKSEVIAAFPEIEVFGSGDVEAEAIINLKSEIKDLYIEIINTPEKELGQLPLKWKRILGKVIKKVGNA